MLVEVKTCEVLNTIYDDLILGCQINFNLSHMSEGCIDFCVWWEIYKTLDHP